MDGVDLSRGGPGTTAACARPGLGARSRGRGSMTPARGDEYDRDEPTVLVVDDHRLFGSSLVLALESGGLRARECPVTTVDDILRSVEDRPSGLVLLDLELGVGDRGEPIDELDVIAGLRARGWSALVVSAATDDRR